MFFERLVVSVLWLHNGPVCIGVGFVCVWVGSVRVCECMFA